MQATPAQDILRVPSVRVRYYLKASIPYLKLSNQLDWVQNTHGLKISVWQYFFQYIEEHLKNKRQRESLNPCANTTNPCRWCEWSSSAQNVITVMRVFFLKRNWMLTLKLYTRTPPEVWWLVIALNWNQLKVRRKKTFLGDATDCWLLSSLWSSTSLCHHNREDPSCQHCHSCQNFVEFMQSEQALNWFQPRRRKDSVTTEWIVYRKKDVDSSFLNFHKILSVFYANIFHGTKSHLVLIHPIKREFRVLTECIKIIWVNARLAIIQWNNKLHTSLNRLSLFRRSLAGKTVKKFLQKFSSDLLLAAAVPALPMCKITLFRYFFIILSLSL